VRVDEQPAIGLEWPAFMRMFRERWQPGQHVACIGPTGVGKTTVAGHLLSQRRFVLALDPKGGDSTLGELAGRGFERIDKWPPPRRVFEDIANGKPARLIVGTPVRSDQDRVKLRELFQRTLAGAFEQGGWTVYVDELQIAADARLMNLTTQIELNLIAARDRAVSVVSSFQRPARVPRTASDQATYLFVWYTRDDDVVKRIAEMMGRPKPEVRGAVSELDEHAILVVSRNPREPMIVAKPPPLGRVVASRRGAR
jgi:hypothetical protein